jgi:ankyrin repeat protein
VNARTLAGNTALIYAENNGHTDTAEILKKVLRAKPHATV